MSDPARVLLVEDDFDVAEVLALILSRNGYEVQVAHNGREALEMVKASAPHCVLLDIELPGMDGAELSAHLRALYGDDVILIAITGRSQTDARVASAFARVDHYLQKPIDAAMLSKVLPPVT